jgi:hypothetical protein
LLNKFPTSKLKVNKQWTAKEINGKNNHPKVGENILPLHILSAKPDLPEGLVLILLQVSQGHLENPVLQPL